MAKSNSGFIYLWYDKKHKRFYVGSHWGMPDDGYICSSRWMRKAYRRRPEDFKRRILKIITTTYKDLLSEEHRWLHMIKDQELGKKYYNLNQGRVGHWAADPNSAKTVGQKISASPNRNANISKALMGRVPSEQMREKLRQANLGKTYSEEVNKKKGVNNRDYSDPIFLAKMSAAAKNRSLETRMKISKNNKRLQAEGKIGMKGRKHSDETKEHMRKNWKNQTTINL